MCVQLLAFATEEISLRVGQTLAGLLEVTLVSDLFRFLSRLGLTICREMRQYNVC